MAGEKPRVICPYCQRDGTVLANGQPSHFTINGMTAHVRAHHPNDYKDWQSNKSDYAVSNACDASGQPLKGGSPAGDTFPEEPEPEPDDEYIIEELTGEEPNEPEPEPEPEPKPKPKPKRKPKPKSEPEPEPEPEGYEYNPYGFSD